MGTDQAATDVRERLNRYLARAGIGSRRRADDLIASGRVTVNGKPVPASGCLVNPACDSVAVDGVALQKSTEKSIWIVLNKPADVLTTRRDVRGRTVIFELLPPEYGNLIPVGRLDLDTSGVILFTSDGHAANRLMHPRYQVERIYEANIDGVPSQTDLKRLATGVDLGDRTLAVATVEIARKRTSHCVLRISIREGRKREIKRMMIAIGFRVRRLKRLSYAGISAGTLRAGGWRHLTKKERQALDELLAVT